MVYTGKEKEGVMIGKKKYVVYFVLICLLLVLILPSNITCLFEKNINAENISTLRYMRKEAVFLSRYYDKHGCFPENTMSYRSVDNNPASEFKDYWGEDFVFVSSKNVYVMISKGADRELNSLDDLCLCFVEKGSEYQIEGVRVPA